MHEIIKGPSDPVLIGGNDSLYLVLRHCGNQAIDVRPLEEGHPKGSHYCSGCQSEIDASELQIDWLRAALYLPPEEEG
jgi:hypothetical protein